jgi:ABC-type amino acid transport substrate-binding protein
VGAAVLVVAVCAFGAWQLWGAPKRGDTRPASLTETSSPSGAVPAPLGAVPPIAATVPADVRATGRLVIGVNVPYAPNEFKNSAGEIVGFDVDVMNAVARTLGLTPDYRETAFEGIMPSVHGGDFNVGMSSFTDNKARESTVDFVTYFQAGTLWAQQAGSSVDPSAACGLRIGVTYASIQETDEVPAKSDQCVAAGVAPIEKVVYTRQDDLTAALIAGKVDAMAADSPVTGFAVKLSGGKLEPAGEIFDTAPYGWPVAKGSALAGSLRQALEHLMSTGEYRTIATRWGVEKGIIDKPVINGAIK